MASVFVDSVSISPNPVIVNKQYVISVGVSELFDYISDADGKGIRTDTGALLKVFDVLSGNLLAADGSALYTSSGKTLDHTEGG